MKDIIVEYPFEDHRKLMTLHNPSGGGPGYHINVDGFHQGVLILYQGIWEYHGDKFDFYEVELLRNILKENGV